MDVAQSPPLCDWLGEPLGLGERWSLTLAAPAGPSRPLLLFLPALPFIRQKLQLGSGLLFFLASICPPSCYVILVLSFQIQNQSPLEREPQNLSVHIRRGCSQGSPSNPSHAHLPSNRRHISPDSLWSSLTLEKSLGLAPLHSYTRSSVIFREAHDACSQVQIVLTCS